MQSRLAILAVLAAACVAVPSAEQRASRERQIVVGAALSTGAPVTDLTATDFIVREDGVAREVIRVGPAPPPSHLVLLVDDSQAMQTSVPFLRSGLALFIRKLGATTPAPQMSLVTFGERPTTRAAFSPAAATVEQAAGKIFSIPGSGSYFLQALMEVCRDLRKRSAASPVIVAFVDEASPEFSSETHKQIGNALQAAGASLWAIVRQDSRNVDRSREGYEREATLGDATTNSGGMTRAILSPQSVEPAFETMASLLTSRYAVVYGSPDRTIPATTLEVSAKRADVRILASRWIR